MVMIPTSQGPRVNLSANPTSVAPIQPGLIGQAIQNLGQQGEQLAAQQIRFETLRTEALQSAKAIDYSTKLQEIDNQFELRAQQIPSTPDKFGGMTDRLLTERNKAVEGLLGSEQDPVVKALATRTANAYAVGVKDKLSRYQLSKEAEYGQHVITTKLDSIGEQLAQTSNPAQVKALEGQAAATMKAGLASRYIDFKFIDNYQDQLKKISAARDAEAIQRTALSAYLDGRAFADPNNPKDQKIIDGAFTRMINSNDPSLVDNAVNLSIKTGIVPNQLVSTFSGRLSVGSTEQKVQAAQVISKITSQNPRLISQFPASVQATSLAINRNIEAGVSPEKAVEYAEKDLKENKSFDRDRREQSYSMDSSKKLREENIKSLKSKLAGGGLFSSAAQVPDALIGQHEFLAKEFYMNEGLNIQDANAAATDIIRSQWKVTEIGGQKKLQRYAPESQYHVPGVPDSWIKNQVLDTLSGQVKQPAKPVGLVSEGTIDLSKRPVVRNADGSISTLRSAALEEDGKVVLIPTIHDGKVLNDSQARNLYKRTGQHLGIFNSLEAADDYAKTASEYEGSRYAAGTKSAFLGEGKFIADIKAPTNFFPGKTKEEIDEEIELSVDPKTAGSRTPAYLVSRKVDDYGRVALVLDANNQPIRIRPDFSKTDEYKESLAAREALSTTPEAFAQRLYEKRKGLDLSQGAFNNYIPPAVDAFNRRGFKNEPYSGGGL